MDTGCQYLDPVAEPVAAQEPYLPRLARTGKPRIAQFPNLFTDSAAFLADLSDALTAIVPQASFPYFDKKFGRYMSTPASPGLREEIVAGADAVMLAYGHCGSCTSGVVHDGVLLARAGVPVAVLVTEKFREEAEFLARALGLPELPLVIIPYPIAGESAEYQRALADAIAHDVLAALTDGRSADCTRILAQPSARAA